MSVWDYIQAIWLPSLEAQRKAENREIARMNALLKELPWQKEPV